MYYGMKEISTLSIPFTNIHYTHSSTEECFSVCNKELGFTLHLSKCISLNGFLEIFLDSVFYI